MSQIINCLPLSTGGSYKVKPNKMQPKRKYIINLNHLNIPQRNDNSKTTNKKGYPRVRLSMCYPNHPSNGRYPFLEPSSASSPSPPPQAYPHPRSTGANESTPTNQGWCLASSKRSKRIRRQTDHRRVGWLRGIELHRICRGDQLQRIRLHGIRWC